ncbi:hypothetical protein GEMRC1_011935 [Eukaryota sp. GEM-RC1]
MTVLPSDLSVRTSLYRTKLIEDFRLGDNAGHSTADVPLLSTRDISLDPEAFKRFYHFHRLPSDVNVDKRMTRVRHLNSIPVGVWASWMVNHRHFQNFILLTIILNAIALVFSTDVDRTQFYLQLQLIDYFESFSLLVFMTEIVLKWINSFKSFWDDGWNNFDFGITVISSIPEVFGLFVGERSYQLWEIIRVLRLFKTLRILKAIVRFKNLKIIVNTCLKAAASLGSLVLLLSVFIFLYAIFGMYLFENYSNSEIPRRYQYKFQSLPNSFLAVFQIFTFDQWFHVMNDVKNDVHPAIVIVYWMSWIWLGSFIIRNVVIGVICKTFEDMKKKSNKEDKLLKRTKSSLFNDFAIDLPPDEGKQQSNHVTGSQTDQSSSTFD